MLPCSLGMAMQAITRCRQLLLFSCSANMECTRVCQHNTPHELTALHMHYLCDLGDMLQIQLQSRYA